MCEYTGKVWFVKLSGIRFREVVQVLDVKHDDDDSRSSVTLQCTSSFDRKGKGNFVPCARVMCKIGAVMAQNGDVDVRIMECSGELLNMKLLPGKKQIVSVITSIFRDAMDTYMDEFKLLTDV